MAALEKLSGRKPWGPGGTYGERALSVQPVTAVEALFWGLKTAVFIVQQSVCMRFDPDRGRCAAFQFAAHKGVWPVWLNQLVCSGWGERAFGHAACFLRGARDLGTCPRLAAIS